MARAEIRARATLDNKQFQTGIAQMNQGVQRFASGQIRQIGSMIAGAFATGALVNFARSSGEAADKIQDFAASLSMTGEELQTLQRLAELNGSSAQAMAAALKRAAIEGVKIEDVAKVMRGVSVEGVSLEQAIRVAGEQGAELNTVFDILATDGLESVKQQFIETNQIMTEDTVNAIANMQESWDRSMTSMANKTREWAVAAITKFKEVAAFWGAVSGGASFSDAAAIASQTVAEEFAGPGPTSRGRSRRDIVKAGATTPAAAGITVSAPQAADQLAKIGAIVGGQTDPNRAAAERAIKIQEKIEDQMKKLNDKMGKIEQYTKNLEE